MKREFINTSTARLALQDIAGLGYFELHQRLDNTGYFAFLLKLDRYQSNCHRLWLEYRWRLNSLAGAQIEWSGTKQLIMSLQRAFSTEEAALEAFSKWTEWVLQDLEVASSERI